MSRADVIIKEINEDFSKDIEDNKKIIILVEHSKSPSKIEVFKRYIERRFYKNISEYVIAIARKEQIPTNRMKPSYVTNLLEEDMKEEYENFIAKYPKAKIDSEYTFHYCIDLADDSKGEIMSVALLRIKDGFCKIEYSPIIPISSNQYNAIVNGNEENEEDILLHNIMTEQLIGDDLYGIVGYLTNGKFTTLDMYMQNLCDIIPILKNMPKRRSKVINYKKHKINNKIYLDSLYQEKQMENVSDDELENMMI